MHALLDVSAKHLSSVGVLRNKQRSACPISLGTADRSIPTLNGGLAQHYQKRVCQVIAITSKVCQLDRRFREADGSQSRNRASSACTALIHPMPALDLKRPPDDPTNIERQTHQLHTHALLTGCA